MRKALCLAALVLFFAGCKKQEVVYEQNLNGTWQVYKYLLYNVDQTQQYQNLHGNYTITFTSGGAFNEKYGQTGDTITTSGTYTFANNDQQLVLKGIAVIPLTDSTVYDSSFVYTYTIFNLTASTVQLRTDTSQLYMSKK